MKIGIRIEHFAPGSELRTMLPYTEIRDYAQEVEAGGLDSIWISDHMIYRFSPEFTAGPWECWTLLSALTAITNRVELGTLVLCNPFRNPALLAKMAHTLDEISGGRLILGIGAGWHQPEFNAYGFPYDKRVDRLEEALQILSPLLKGKRVDFTGTHYQVENCIVTPLGPREKGIPLLIGALGPRMMRLTAQYADQWNRAWLGDPQDIIEPLERLWKACAEVNRDPDTLEVTVSVSVAFPDLGKANPFSKKPLSGSVEEIANAFQRYAESGVNHIILQPTPQGLPALQRVIEAVRLYQDMA
jgi:probable F420-dependent oxidoreductase